MDGDAIQPNARAVVEYELSDEDGTVIDASRLEGGGPIEYVHGYGMIVPGLEAALEGMKVGEEKTILVKPEAAFGEHDPELVLEIDRADFPRPKNVKVGDEFVAESPEGDEVTMRVVKVEKDAVVVDANHPLAGRTLRYAVKVLEVRAATAQEIEVAAADFEDAGYTGTGGGAGGPGEGDGSDLVRLRRKPGT
jgi:FKBP-type peptidyl-prolyl cis-trans isomerase SlyD